MTERKLYKNRNVITFLSQHLLYVLNKQCHYFLIYHSKSLFRSLEQCAAVKTMSNKSKRHSNPPKMKCLNLAAYDFVRSRSKPSSTNKPAQKIKTAGGREAVQTCDELFHWRRFVWPPERTSSTRP